MHGGFLPAGLGGLSKPGRPGAPTQGKTLAKAKANLRDAIRLMLRPARVDKLPKVRIVPDRVRV